MKGKRELPDFCKPLELYSYACSPEEWIEAIPDQSQKKVDIIERYGLKQFTEICKGFGIKQYNIIGSAAASLIDPTGIGDPEDIDIYFTNYEDYLKISDIDDFEKHGNHIQLMGSKGKYIQIASSPLFHKNSKEVMDTFDFTICMAAIEVYLSKKELEYKFVFHENTMEDLENKWLTINSLPNPGASCYRMAKYIARGYIISQEDAQILVKAVKLERAHNKLG